MTVAYLTVQWKHEYLNPRYSENTYFLGLVQSLCGIAQCWYTPYVCAVYQVIVMKALEYYGFYIL